MEDILTLVQVKTRFLFWRRDGKNISIFKLKKEKIGDGKMGLKKADKGGYL